jgi:F-type H+-transporting ATPase subunit delta
MTFSAEPWARAFLEAFARKNAFPVHWTERESDLAGEALEALCVYNAAGCSVPGELSGFSDAVKFAPVIDAALAKTGTAANGAAVYARGFFLLMIKKGCFCHHKKIEERIQNLINEKKGRVEAVLETPFEADSAFVASVEQILLQKFRAREITVKTRLVPDLVGGLRLRMGSILFDGSLKTRLERMKADLSYDLSWNEASRS